MLKFHAAIPNAIGSSQDGISGVWAKNRTTLKPFWTHAHIGASERNHVRRHVDAHDRCTAGESIWPSVPCQTLSTHLNQIPHVSREHVLLFSALSARAVSAWLVSCVRGKGLRASVRGSEKDTSGNNHEPSSVHSSQLSKCRRLRSDGCSRFGRVLRTCIRSQHRSARQLQHYRRAAVLCLGYLDYPDKPVLKVSSWQKRCDVLLPISVQSIFLDVVSYSIHRG
jgi:hypothetical protein